MRPPRPGRLARPAAASGQWPLARSASAGVRERKTPGRAPSVTTRLPSAPLSIAREMLWSPTRYRTGYLPAAISFACWSEGRSLSASAAWLTRCAACVRAFAVFPACWAACIAPAIAR